MKIFLVEDGDRLRELLKSHLRAEGFQVFAYSHGTKAVEAFPRVLPALAILDVSLPDISGFEVMRRIRTMADTPVLLMSTRTEESDKVSGLNLGGDDYLPKPFSPRHLLARIKAVLRRVHQQTPIPDEVYTFGPLKLDATRRLLGRQGTWLPLTSSEFCILQRLVKTPHKIFPRRELERELERERGPLKSRAVDNHVLNLRHKLQELGACRSTVQSIRGVGYRLSV